MAITCIQPYCITEPCGKICHNEAGQIVNENGSPVIGLAPGSSASVQPGIFGGTQASLPPELRGSKPNERANSSTSAEKEALQQADKGMSIGSMVAIAAVVVLVWFVVFKQ